jgi:hypothetical protein
MSKPTIAKLSVTANDYSVESMKITLAINEVPTASLTVVRQSDQRVRKPMSADVVAAIRERQQKRLSGLVAPDMVISADDGMGGKLDFVGYQIVPVVEIGTASTTDSFTVLSVDGMLDALDLSYYSIGYYPTRAEASSYGTTTDLILDPIPGAQDGKVTQLISNISQIMIKNYDATVRAESHPSMQALITQQHVINAGLPINLWLRMLSNSDVVYESWAEACKTVPGQGNRMSLRIVEMLKQKVGGFWSIANSLMATFQMYYVPNPAESGKFVRADKKVAETSEAMNLSVSSISVSDGNHRLLPVGGVVMMRPTTPATRPESGYAPGTNSVAAQFPKQLLTGFVQREMPPAWLLGGDGSPVAGSDLDRTTASTSAKLNLSIPDYLKRKKSADEKKAEIDNSAVSMLDELCEVMFNEMQLAHSTAVATIPLDYTRKVGERVVVNILSGGSFTAFVSRIIHSVDLRQGKELNSFTQISFTHVRY